MFLLIVQICFVHPGSRCRTLWGKIPLKGIWSFNNYTFPFNFSSVKFQQSPKSAHEFICTLSVGVSILMIKYEIFCVGLGPRVNSVTSQMTAFDKPRCPGNLWRLLNRVTNRLGLKSFIKTSIHSLNFKNLLRAQKGFKLCASTQSWVFFNWNPRK